MPEHAPEVWLAFAGLVVFLLVLDLGVLNRRAHALSHREAILWSAGIILTALLFGLWLLVREGHQTALEYFTGYLIELSLSVDNLFVFLIIFQYFAVPPELQPRVLKWGIFGAVLMRGFMVAGGALLIQELEWIIYIFGVILIITGIRVFKSGGHRVEPEKNPLVRVAKRLMPVTSTYSGQHFFVSTVKGLSATPLFLVLLVIEWSDLVFAIDSIPAVFAITRDPFIVYTSNLFAILGLRALFFVVAGAMERFAYLKPAVALILVFVGAKMVGAHWVHLPTGISLGIILGVLSAAIVASVLKRPKEVSEET
ncbi:MAG TPA: TerC family protein [Gemmatimonadales bacterium]|nr:TerC family protein [Gemmatimonadales bacterium]